MSNHDSAIVPLESWAYASPELKITGKNIDLGLFVEALLYYDCVIVNPSNPLQLAELIQWFKNQDAIDDFFVLMNEGSLKIYDYSFMTTAIYNKGVYSLVNIQDPIQQEENTFYRRYLYHKSIEEIFPKPRNRTRLYNSFNDNVFEVKANEFGSAIENAKEDFNDDRRNEVILQALVDKIYSIQNLGRPPKIEVKIESKEGRHTLHFNLSLKELDSKINNSLHLHQGVPLTASAHSNRLIYSALSLKSDLFLPEPMSLLVGDKLYESKQKIHKSGEIIESLKHQVEFPDIRMLINTGQIGIKEVLKIRSKSKKFRNWLQQENGRDRDAIIAYHNEIAKEMGFTKFTRKSLKLFGILGGGAVGGIVGSAVAGPIGGAVGGVAGSALSYLTEIGAGIGENWKPVFFGEWLKDRIEKIV